MSPKNHCVWSLRYPNHQALPCKRHRMGFGLTVEGTARMLVGGVVVYGDGVVYVEVVVHRTEGKSVLGVPY